MKQVAILDHVYSEVIAISGSCTTSASSRDDGHEGMTYDTFALLVDLVAPSDSDELKRLWFNMADVSCENHISAEEFSKLPVIVRAPLSIRKPQIVRSAPLYPAIENLVFHSVCTFNSEEVKADCGHSTGQYSKAHTMKVHRASTCKREDTPRWCSYFNFMFLANFIALVEPLLRDNFHHGAYTCKDELTIWWFLYVLVFGTDLILSGLAFATEKLPYWYIWPMAVVEGDKKQLRFHFTVHFIHLLDVIYVALCIFAIANVCSSMDNRNWRLALSPLRGVKFAVLLHTIPNVKRISSAMYNCVMSILPIVALFVIVYYTFICFGCSFLAGCVTELPPAGPGRWSTAPWNTTTFGKAEYYYDLNFGIFECLNASAVLSVCALFR